MTEPAGYLNALSEGRSEQVIAPDLSQHEVRAAAGALIGGLLWATKSVSILLADYQPALTFEVAPFFMGLAALGVAAKMDRGRRAAYQVVLVVALLGVLTGGLSVLLFIGSGDSEAFGIALMISMLSILAVLGYGGWLVRGWSVRPVAIFVVTFIALPVGGALSEVDERLLEVPLLIVSVAWITLSLRLWEDAARRSITSGPV